MTRSPHPIDIHVGGRIRLRRILVGMSQEKLGDRLGLTCQQIQKYEKGVNRIGASRIYLISQILDVPIQFFFDDIDESISGGARSAASGGGPGFSEPDGSMGVMDFVNSLEGVNLNTHFRHISDSGVRKGIIDLVKTLSRR